MPSISIKAFLRSQFHREPRQLQRFFFFLFFFFYHDEPHGLRPKRGSSSTTLLLSLSRSTSQRRIPLQLARLSFSTSSLVQLLTYHSSSLSLWTRLIAIWPNFHLAPLNARIRRTMETFTSYSMILRPNAPSLNDFQDNERRWTTIKDRPLVAIWTALIAISRGPQRRGTVSHSSLPSCCSDVRSLRENWDELEFSKVFRHVTSRYLSKLKFSNFEINFSNLPKFHFSRFSSFP